MCTGSKPECSTFKKMFLKICRTLHTTRFGLKSLRSYLLKVNNDKDFEEKVTKSRKTIIVKFFANWCGPCRTLGPRVENAVAQREGEICLAPVDIDDMGDIAMKYEVETIPALVAFQDGKVHERLNGLQDEEKINKWLDKVIGKK